MEKPSTDASTGGTKVEKGANILQISMVKQKKRGRFSSSFSLQALENTQF